MVKSKLTNTSIHIAAHAVLSYVLGPYPTYVYSANGESYIEVDKRFRLDMDDECIYHLAGSCAEHLWCDVEKTFIIPHDLLEINNLKLGFDEIYKNQAKTYNHLKRTKDDIFKVAKCLDAHKTIKSSKEFKELLLGK